MCNSHYAKHSCGHGIAYKITYCLQQVGYLKDRQKGIPCEDRTHIYADKPVDDICHICTFQDALKRDPDAGPPRRALWETACEDDGTAFVAGYELMAGKRAGTIASNEDSDKAA